MAHVTSSTRMNIHNKIIVAYKETFVILNIATLFYAEGQF